MVRMSIGLKGLGNDMIQEEKSNVGTFRTCFTDVMEVHHSAGHLFPSQSCANYHARFR